MPARMEAPPERCPKCGGYVAVERDWFGTYGSCVNCGYCHDVVSEQVDTTLDRLSVNAQRFGKDRMRRPSIHGMKL